MALQEKFKAIYEKYSKERHLEFDENVFSSIITTFPSLLVASADAKVDNNEKLLLVSISKSLANSFVDNQTEDSVIELLSYQYYAEFDYLIKNIDKWKHSFIDVLTDYLIEFPDNKQLINEMIIDVANASDGICEAELNVIKEIELTLNLK
jgi:hypothetical protein